MTDQQILDLLTTTLRDLLGDDTILLSRESVRSDVDGWDSFAYVTFIAAVELQLGLKFAIADVESFVTVGDIVDEVRRLMG